MTQEIQAVIDRAVASGRLVTVVVIDGRVAGVATPEASVVTAGPVQDAVSPDPARRTPLERVEAVLAVAGDELRKESEWAADICAHGDFSARELERACQHSGLPHSIKDHGRDSGARLIRGNALKDYLELRQAVQNGERAQPEWWPKVVQGRHRSR